MKMNCETVRLPKPHKYTVKDLTSNRNTLNFSEAIAAIIFEESKVRKYFLGQDV